MLRLITRILNSNTGRSRRVEEISLLLSGCFLLMLGVFGDALGISISRILSVINWEIGLLLFDPKIEWLIFACLFFYFCGLIVVEVCRSTPHFAKKGRELVWIMVFVGLITLSYIVSYPVSQRAMILLVGAVLGRITSLWLCGRTHERCGIQSVLIMLVACFSIASFVVIPGRSRPFFYQNQQRWSGPWESPNLYGILMGVALILAIGLGHLIPRARTKWSMAIGVLGCTFAGIVCGVGLFKSYSRGAWLATVVGASYLFWQKIRPWGRHCPSSSNPIASSRLSWFQKRRILLLMLCASLIVLSFWQFRFTEWSPARRIFSVVNVNDFSWRNRVTAWKGAVLMMVERPWIGFGWGHAESAYDKYYRPPQLDSGAAIEMNDFFMLGISTGVPAMICFAIYVTLSLIITERQQITIDLETTAVWLKLVSRAGAVVLLVGFWFDGGLFRLVSGSVFWILLELGRVEMSSPSTGRVLPLGVKQHSSSSVSEQESVILVQSDSLKNHTSSRCGRCEIWLRRAVWSISVVAALQTVVCVGTPFFIVSQGTLAVARRWLVPHRAISDLDILAADPVWRGRKLKTLLQHVVLANYNRQLINWHLDDVVYRDYVLPPSIDLTRDGQLNWRRSLWECFYPPVRKETEPQTAAEIVIRHLDDMITIVRIGPLTIDEMWAQRKADAEGFEVLKVASFRSVGIPARLGTTRKAEIFAEGKWQSAPQSISSEYIDND